MFPWLYSWGGACMQRPNVLSVELKFKLGCFTFAYSLIPSFSHYPIWRKGTTSVRQNTTSNFHILLLLPLPLLSPLWLQALVSHFCLAWRYSPQRSSLQSWPTGSSIPYSHCVWPGRNTSLCPRSQEPWSCRYDYAKWRGLVMLFVESLPTSHLEPETEDLVLDFICEIWDLKRDAYRCGLWKNPSVSGAKS